MKTRPILIIISLPTVLSGCGIFPRKRAPEVVQVQPVHTSGTTLPRHAYDSVRNAEVIKQYYAGAYVDPNNPNVRHDPHDIQRVEQAASWNLRPNAPVVAGGPTYTAASSAAQTNAIGAQLSGALDRQKGYTDALAQQNEKLQDVIEQMNAAKEQEAAARAATEAELKLTVDTLKSLKDEIRKPTPAPRPFPAFTPSPSPTLFDRLNGPEPEAPSNSQLTPKAQDLLDTVDQHITALENKKSSRQTEDTIDLDDIYAPLAAKVAQGKK